MNNKDIKISRCFIEDFCWTKNTNDQIKKYIEDNILDSNTIINGQPLLHHAISYAHKRFFEIILRELSIEFINEIKKHIITSS